MKLLKMFPEARCSGKHSVVAEWTMIVASMSLICVLAIAQYHKFLCQRTLNKIRNISYMNISLKCCNKLIIHYFTIIMFRYLYLHLQNKQHPLYAFDVDALQKPPLAQCKIYTGDQQTEEQTVHHGRPDVNLYLFIVINKL